MSKIDMAVDVLLKAQEQLVSEIAQCGNGGGVGRAQNYAPVLVNVTNALEVVQKMQGGKIPQAVQDRMAAVRAAKQTTQSV